MRDFFRSPLFRCLVCLILVCCILVNVSPIRARAFALSAGAAIGYTVMALLLMASCGVVFSPQGQQGIRDFADDLDDELTKQIGQWVKTDEDWADLKEMAERMYSNMFDDYEDPGNGGRTRFALAEGLLDGIAALVYTTLLTGFIDKIMDADEGFQYYNGILLPDFSKNVDLSYSNYNYRVILYNSNNKQFTLYVAPSIGTVSYSSGAGYNLFKPGSSISYYAYFSSAQWNGGTSVGASISYGITDPVSIVWSSHDLYFDDGSLFFPGSEPSTTYAEPIDVSAYVGDLKEAVDNGDKDQDDIKIPAVVDFSEVFANGETAEEGVTNTLQQLADGTLSYEDYLEMITPEDAEDPDPTTATDPSIDPSDPSEDVPEDIAQYTFDLRRIFPFCIPFDLYDFLTCLNAAPVAPVIHWEIQLPGGGSYPLDLDLSPFDSVAQLLRRLQLLAFCIALGIKTRDLIKG